MNEQKGLKKKRAAEDYSLIGSIISLAIVAFLVLAKTVSEAHRLNPKYTENEIFVGLLLSALVILVISFFAGIIGLWRSIQTKAKFTRYLKALLGIGVSGGFLFFLANAIPSFVRFPARAKQSEAKQNLGAIFAAYYAYHSDYHTYPISPTIQDGNSVFNCLSIAGWAPKGQIRYNYNCMNTEVFSPATKDSPCPTGIVISATKDSFTVAACGNVDNDATVDVWTINNDKKLRNVVDDVRN